MALIGTGRRTWSGGLSGKFEEQMRSPFAEMGFYFQFCANPQVSRAQSRMQHVTPHTASWDSIVDEQGHRAAQ